MHEARHVLSCATSATNANPPGPAGKTAVAHSGSPGDGHWLVAVDSVPPLDGMVPLLPGFTVVCWVAVLLAVFGSAWLPDTVAVAVTVLTEVATGAVTVLSTVPAELPDVSEHERDHVADWAFVQQVHLV